MRHQVYLFKAKSEIRRIKYILFFKRSAQKFKTRSPNTSRQLIERTLGIETPRDYLFVC